MGGSGVSINLYVDDLDLLQSTAEEIAGAVNAEVVQVVGRTFVLYRQNAKEPRIKLPK